LEEVYRKVMDGDTWLHLAKDHTDGGLRLLLEFGLRLRQSGSSCWVGLRKSLKGRVRLQIRTLPGKACHLGHRWQPVAKAQPMS